MPQIDAKTKVCAVIGHPIGHSLSPALHNAAVESLGLPYVYVAHDVEPGQVGQVLDGVRAMGYRGLSVTIPHKTEAREQRTVSPDFKPITLMIPLIICGWNLPLYGKSPWVPYPVRKMFFSKNDLSRDDECSGSFSGLPVHIRKCRVGCPSTLEK